MKKLLILSFLFIHSFASGQTYIKGVATDSIDQWVSDAIALNKASKFKEALLKLDSLFSYWSEEIERSPTDTTLQNYYYSVLRRYEPKILLRKIEKSDLGEYILLEKKIIRDLSESNLLMADYYDFLGSIYRHIIKDYPKAIAAYDKSKEVLTLSPTKNYKFLGRIAQSMGYIYSSQREYEKSHNSFVEAIEYRQSLKEPDTVGVLFAKYAMGVNYYAQANYQTALDTFQSAFRKAKISVDRDNDLYIGLRRAIGVMYRQIGDVQKSLEFALEVLEEMKQKEGNSRHTLDQYYSDVSTLYRDLGNIVLAQTYIDSALQIANKDHDKGKLAGLYNQKAILNTDLNVQVKLLQKAVDNCSEDPSCTKANYAIFLHNLGDAFAQRGDIQSALNYILESKKIREGNYKTLGSSLSFSYSFLSQLHDLKGELDIALDYQEKALGVAKDFRPHDSHFVATELSRLGKLNTKKDNLILAESQLIKAKTIMEKSVGKNNAETLLLYEYLGNLYGKKGDYEAAQSYYQLSIDQVLKRPVIKKGVLINPYTNLSKLQHENGEDQRALQTLQELVTKLGFDEFGNSEINSYKIEEYSLFHGYKGLMSYLEMEEKILGDDQKYTVEKIKTALVLIDELRSNYFFESSDKEIQKTSRTFFNWATRKLSKLYLKSSDPDILDLMFVCIERSKSILVDRQLQRDIAIQNGDIPTEAVIKEKTLLYNYEKAYDKYVNSSDLENDSLHAIAAEEMYELQREKTVLQDSLRQLYPDYYSSDSGHNPALFSEFRSLLSDNGQVGIIYHWGDSILHRLTVTGHTTKYASLPLDSINKKIDSLYQILNYNYAEGTEDIFDLHRARFILTSRSLHNLLLDDEDIAEHKRLLIIPDDKLVNVPFDILLTDSNDRSMSYDQLDYLLRSHAVSYIGSATEYSNRTSTRPHPYTRDYVGFAPDYGPSQDNSMAYRSSVDFDPLLYNTGEVEAVNELFDGEQYTGMTATEGVFKKNAQDNRILHLAMHTKLDESYPMESYLSFVQDTSIDEDGKLYAYEISRMQLNNQLVVLSACQTNVGVPITGEGLLGIARAFQAASCPNLIVSNWLVDDKSSSQVMYNFFGGIKKNKALDVSLRDAKLNYLNQSSTAQSHPGYWAGFSYYGTPTEFRTKNKWSYLPYGLGTVCLLLFGLFFFKKSWQPVPN